MPYRPESELKRPDLKGEFICGHCEKMFCHAASLNRHRLNFHGDGQMCMICDDKIGKDDTVRRHMLRCHSIKRVFTCGCCNWTFPDKKELHSHNNSMTKTGVPGQARVIAMSSRPPGSLAQHEVKGIERQLTVKPKKKKAMKGEARNENDIPNVLGNYSQAPTMVPSETMLNLDAIGTLPAHWLAFIMGSSMGLTGILNALQDVQNQNQTQPATTEDSSTSLTPLMTANNSQEEAQDDTISLLSSERLSVELDDHDSSKDMLSDTYVRDFLTKSSPTPEISNASTSTAACESSMGHRSGGISPCTNSSARASPISPSSHASTSSGASTSSAAFVTSPAPAEEAVASRNSMGMKIDAIASSLARKQQTLAHCE